MSTTIPHGKQATQRSDEENVRTALEIIQLAPESVVERMLLERSQGPSSVYLSSMSRILGFTQAVNSLASALASLDTAVPPGVARAAQATENVWRQIETEFGLLSSGEVAKALGAVESNRGYASTRRKRGELAGIERKNAFLYPGFQLDVEEQRVRAWVAPLLQLATEHDRSESDALVWMVVPSTYFDGARPVDHLDDPERILAGAARSWNTEW